MNVSRLFVFGIILGPLVLWGQKKEELQSVQRDVAQLQEQVKQLQSSQDEKMAALQAMLQQAVEASKAMASGVTAMEKQIDAKLSQQQTSLVAPVATVGTKVDQLSDDVRALATSVSDLARKMGALDSKLSDISSAIRTLSAPPVAPPPPVGQSATPSGPPPGVSEESLYQNAYRDYNGGKFDLAMDEFGKYLQYFPDKTDHGAAAQYYIGYMYFNATQYPDAIKAFSAVLDFPENSRTSEAMYYRAVSMMKNDQKSDAGAEFKAFLKKYPGSEHVAQAHSNLRALGLEAAPKKRPSR
jgi:TolA-binding protein